MEVVGGVSIGVLVVILVYIWRSNAKLQKSMAEISKEISDRQREICRERADRQKEITQQAERK